MNTITAKELRDNLGEVARKVARGETYSVTYRSKTAFRITGEQTIKSSKPGNTFTARVNSRKIKNKKPVFDPHKSIKVLYHEMLDNDPKYK